MCNTHGIVGNKIVRSGKKWVKKKNATYGFVTSKTTVYVCIAKKDESSISGTHETFNHGKIIEQPNIAQKCGTGIITNGKAKVHNLLNDRLGHSRIVGGDYELKNQNQRKFEDQVIEPD